MGYNTVEIYMVSSITYRTIIGRIYPKFPGVPEMISQHHVLAIIRDSDLNHIDERKEKPNNEETYYFADHTIMYRTVHIAFDGQWWFWFLGIGTRH